MNELLGKLKVENYLLDCRTTDEFGKKLAYYLGEINVIHPFREGNGRSQRIFIEYIAHNAGYTLDFMKISSRDMLEASARAYAGEYDLMEKIIIGALTKRK